MTLTFFPKVIGIHVSYEPVDEISLNLHQYIFVTTSRDFCDLDLIFKVSLVCGIYFEPEGGFSSNFCQYVQ